MVREFAGFACGLLAATRDEPQSVIEPGELRGTLSLPDRDELEATESDQLDEEDAEVQVQFEELYGEPAVSNAVDDGDDEPITTA